MISNFRVRVMLTLSILLIYSLIFGVIGHGQNGATISGTVKDEKGAVIVRATVTISNTATGMDKTVQTDERGFYTFTGLTPGDYSVTVSKDGFDIATVNAPRLSADLPKSLDVLMKVAGVGKSQIDVSDDPNAKEIAAPTSAGPTRKMHVPISIEPSDVRDWHYMYRPPQYLIVFPYDKEVELKLDGTKLVRGVGGKAMVKNENQATFVNVSLDGVPPVRNLGNFNSYVAWAVLDDGKAYNLGALTLRKEHAELKAATHLKSFRLMITAEQNPDSHEASGFIVAQMPPRVSRKMLSDLKLEPQSFNIVGSSYFNALYSSTKDRKVNPIIVYPPNQAVELEFRGTDYAPDSSGTAHIMNHGPDTEIALDFTDLPELGAGLNGYVIWAVFSDGQHFHLGSISKSQAQHARLTTHFGFNSFGIMVTAETQLDTLMPSSRYLLVMDNIDRHGISDHIVFLPPIAKCAETLTFEANSPNGGVNVPLHGEGQANPDSPSASSIKIVSYKWDVDDQNKFQMSGADVRTNLGYGKHAVALKVTDSIGLETIKRMTVNVVDTTPPEIRNLPSVLKVEAQNPAGTAVRLPAPFLVDAGDGSPQLRIETPQSFPIGETPVTYIATDHAGNKSTAVLKVQVVDTTPPVIAGLPVLPVIVEAKAANGTPVTIPAPRVTDNGDSQPRLTINAPKLFPLGETAVHYTAVDASGNRAEATVLVRLVDTTPPIIANLPTTPIIAECAAPTGTTVPLPQATVADLVDINPTVTVAAPPNFQKGDSVVTYTAKDASGNMSRATVTVRVLDRTAPVFQNVPTQPIVAEANSLRNTPVILPPVTAVDACTAQPVITSDAPAFYPLGETRVTYTARDGSNNVATAAVTVKVLDRTPPQIVGIPEAPIVVEGTSFRGTAIALPRVTAVDTVDPAPRLAINAPSLFPLGDTQVTYTATDASGNTATKTMTVKVVDRTPPKIIGLAAQPIIVEAQTPAGTRINLPPVNAVDTMDEHPSLTNDLPGMLPLGDTAVTYTGTDASGNKATGRVIVRVVDTTPPKLVGLPTSPIEVAGAGRAGTRVDLPTITATDNADEHPEVSSTAPGLFPLGQTKVTYTARDKSGNHVSGEFVVRVIDKQAPVFANLPTAPIEFEATGPGTKVTLPTVQATDDYDDHPKVVAVNVPASFSLGETPVVFTATDAAGNKSTAQIVIRVKDTRPPELVSKSIDDNTKLWGKSTPIKLTAHDAGSGVAQMILSIDGQNLLSVSDARLDGTIDTTKFSDGAHTLGVMMKDHADNVSNASISIVINNKPPEISIASPSANSTVSNEQVDIKIMVNDAEPTKSKVLFNGKEVNGGFALPAGGGDISAKVKVVNGDNTLSVSTTDSMGKVATTEVRFRGELRTAATPGGN